MCIHYLSRNGFIRTVSYWKTDLHTASFCIITTSIKVRPIRLSADRDCRTFSEMKLHKLLDNKPIEYVAMAFLGEMQAYCDIEDEMVKSMFETIVQGYLKKGYNRATAEMMAREFFRYES